MVYLPTKFKRTNEQKLASLREKNILSDELSYLSSFSA